MASNGRGSFSEDRNMSSSIVEDLLIEILARLPVKSLLRFKSVCKPWCALIQTRDFTHHHLSLQTTTADHDDTNNFGTFILQCYRHLLRPYRHHIPKYLSISGSSGGMASNSSSHAQHELPFPVVFEDFGALPYFKFEQDIHPRHSTRHCRITMVGSCNGILCIHDEFRREIGLWNPATKQFRLLPKSLQDDNMDDFKDDHVLFGFDIKSKDFKVVLITNYGGAEQRKQCILYQQGTYAQGYGHYARRVQVYNLSNDSWRYIDDADIHLRSSCYLFQKVNCRVNEGPYLNGKYFLLARKCCDRVHLFDVFSFDFTKNRFDRITNQLPFDCHEKNISAVQLTLIGEKVVLLKETRSVKDNTYWHELDAWMLNGRDDYCKEESDSWTKLSTVCKRPASIRNTDGELLAISNNGQVGLLYGKVLTYYDFLTTHERNRCLTGKKAIVYKAYAYKPSLVSIQRDGDDQVEIHDSDDISDQEWERITIA